MENLFITGSSNYIYFDIMQLLTLISAPILAISAFIVYISIRENNKPKVCPKKVYYEAENKLKR